MTIAFKAFVILICSYYVLFKKRVKRHGVEIWVFRDIEICRLAAPNPTFVSTGVADKYEPAGAGVALDLKL